MASIIDVLIFLTGLNVFLVSVLGLVLKPLLDDTTNNLRKIIRKEILTASAHDAGQIDAYHDALKSGLIAQQIVENLDKTLPFQVACLVRQFKDEEKCGAEATLIKPTKPKRKLK